MASSGIWGALAGAGKGISENANRAMDKEDKEAIIDYQAIKEEALARVRGGIDADNTKTSNQQQSELRVGEDAARVGLEAGTTHIKVGTDAEVAKQKHLDEMELQRLQNQGSLAAAGAHRTGTGSKTSKRYKTESVVASGGEENGYADVTKFFVTDNNTGIKYEQLGNDFMVAGSKSYDKNKDRSKLESVLAKEGLDEASILGFGRRYGYIPSFAMAALRALE